MIENFINTAKHLDTAGAETLGQFYADSAVFVHPFKTARGKRSIIRQWKMSLRYCPNTTISTSNLSVVKGHDHTIYTFQWQHSFTLPSGTKSINGSTTVCVGKQDLIDIQIDSFDVEYYNSLFANETNY